MHRRMAVPGLKCTQASGILFTFCTNVPVVIMTPMGAPVETHRDSQASIATRCAAVANGIEISHTVVHMLLYTDDEHTFDPQYYTAAPKVGCDERQN